MTTFHINVLWGYFEDNIWYPNLKLEIDAEEQYRRNAERFGEAFTDVGILRNVNKGEI
jgi:hypothetical protein